MSGWWLHVEHDGEEEGPESLTLRGKCGGSPNNRAHRDLRWAPTTVWIADVPWPKLTVERPSGGRVSGAGVDCGSGGGVDCEESYAPGSVVELSAAADAHHRFAGWGGACSGSAASCTVELDADRRVSASFEATSHLLTVERPEHGRVTGSGIDCGSGSGSDCTERLAAGATARLSAAADANHRLLGWTGACAGTPGASCAVVMDGAKTAGAEFGAEQRWLWVSPPRRGRIAGPGIDCGSGSSDCTEQYDHGAEVELTATADANHELASWSGACEGAEASCALRMESNLAAGADFALVRRTLTVERPANGHVAAKGVDCGSGTRAACSTSKAHGSVVVARATADEGYEFESWTGACGAARWPKCQLRLDGDLTVGATFKRAKRTLTVAVAGIGKVTGTGIDCGADCAQDYDYGTAATLTAAPGEGQDFERWEGACAGTATGTVCRLEMKEARSATARFRPQKRTLAVTKTAGGSVSSAPAGISCGADCAEDYDYGTAVELTAAAESGYDFASWGGDCSGSASSTCVLTMEEARTASASFAAECAAATVAHCALDRADSGATVSGACASGHNGSCSYACNNGVWSRSGNTCVPNPQCGDPSSAASACKPGTYGEAPGDRGVWAACSSQTSCEAGTPSWSTTRVDGKCGTAASPCAAGTENNRVVGTEETTWRCAGVDGQRTLTCTGTAGAWNWSCTNGTVTRSDCTREFGKNSASCGGLADPATDDNGCRECNAGYEECGGACVAKCGANSTRNSACGCDCDTGYRADGGVCKKLYTLTVTKTAGGDVSSSPAGIDCGTDCTEKYVDGTTAKLTAAPDANRKLSAWSGACSASASTTCAVLLDGDKTVGAAFVWEKRKLTVARPGNGHVAASGISCGSGGRTDCTEEYDHGTEVTLTATEDRGYDFASWGGDCSASASSSTCNLRMKEARTVSASFAAECAAATVAHCALDRADSGATVSGACTAGYNGSCRYACNNGAWSEESNSCTPKRCPQATKDDCTLPQTASGSSAGSCAAGYSGACRFACSLGEWTETSNSCAPAPCPRGTVNSCVLPRTDSGSTTDGRCAAGYSGACRFACSLGEWTGTSNSCAPAPCPHDTVNSCVLSRTDSGTTTDGWCAAGYSGTCRFACWLGGWTETSNSCTPLGCPEATRDNCVLPATEHGSSSAGSCADGYSGTCRSTCWFGAWTETSNSCKPRSCPEATRNNCVLPPTASGSHAGSCSPGYSGACRFSCSRGTWTQASNSCTPHEACAAGTRDNCALPRTESGASAGSCADGYSGACSYACSDRVWTRTSNTCAMDCPAATTAGCERPATPSGSSAGTCAANYSGTCSYACSDGDWTRTSNTCRPHEACAAGTRNNCALPRTESGSSAGSCADGYSGACSYACSDRVWTRTSNSCAMDCPAATTAGCERPATLSGSSAGSCADGYSGTCSYACSDGDWTRTSNTCRPHEACAAGTRNNCALPRTESGSSAGSCADGYSGACSYACSDRVWTRTSNTCAPLDCPQATLGNCLLPETDHGSSAAGSCAAGYSGTCRFSCSLGDWTEDANTCKTPEQECVERGREWIPPSPERARTCRSSSCWGHDHSCKALPGGSCVYKDHDAILCTNHKDRTCRPYPATAGVCIPLRR